MTHRDDEIPRRTPVLRPREQSSTGPSGASTSTTDPTRSTDPRPEHVARAYTRRQLTGEEPLTLPPPVVTGVEISDTPTGPTRPVELVRLPEPPAMGVIIGFSRAFGGNEYSYTAIKTPRGWYVTGVSAAQPPRTWQQLLAWIDHGQQEPPDIWVATSWQQLTPQPE